MKVQRFRGFLQIQFDSDEQAYEIYLAVRDMAADETLNAAARHYAQTLTDALAPWFAIDPHAGYGGDHSDH